MRLYDFYDMDRVVAERHFGHFVENFVFCGGQVVAWSSLNAPFIQRFTGQDLISNDSDGVFYDQAIFERFYALADGSVDHLAFHNQDTVGVVERTTGQLLCEINTR